jgi:hypothetical protein
MLQGPYLYHYTYLAIGTTIYQGPLAAGELAARGIPALMNANEASNQDSVDL